MTYDAIIQATDATSFYRLTDPGCSEVAGFIAGDLMSDILTCEGDGCVLISSLATEHVVRTADFVGACAVLLVNGKKPTDSLLKLATESGICLFGTSYSLFDTCVRLGSLRS